ncbi:MAG: protease complex subunit PrcB family protein [Gemmatimonadaceae bacterium]
MLTPPPAVALATALVLAIPGCGQPAPTSSLPPNAANVTSAQQPYTRIMSAPTSGFTESENLVLKTDAGLASAWKTVHAGIPGNPAPAIDMAHNMVVLIALGQRSTGGYTVRFDSLTTEAAGAVVRYTVTSPGPGCMNTQMITSPIDVVSVPRIDGTVRFEKTDAVNRC